MGKFVLYAVAAFVLGGLMVAIPMCISFAGYLLMTESSETMMEAWINIALTGFILYLAVVWATQETFAEKYPLFLRAAVFIASPILIMYYCDEWSLVACVLALMAIALIAAYQMLVTVVARHSRDET